MMNKALKGYSKNRFYKKLRAKIYMDSAWKKSCHSFYIGSKVGGFEWTKELELEFDIAMAKVIKLRMEVIE